MVVLSTRMRLAAAFESAVTTAETFRDEAKAQLQAEREKWRRVSGKRERWEKRFVDRVKAVNAAIDAMREAASKL
jgi:hypothetical protein